MENPLIELQNVASIIAFVPYVFLALALGLAGLKLRK
jgi:hypothetical protein